MKFARLSFDVYYEDWSELVAVADEVSSLFEVFLEVGLVDESIVDMKLIPSGNEYRLVEQPVLQKHQQPNVITKSAHKVVAEQCDVTEPDDSIIDEIA